MNMSFTNVIDIIKESIAQSNLLLKLTPEYILVSLGSALICGLIMYLIYKFFYRGACYSENFNLLIVMTNLVTCFIIMTISSNIVLSLGMVGALSIVRFRAAVKDPLDVGFLFWAVGAGLTSGAGLYIYALFGTIAIAVIYVLFVLVRGRRSTYLLIVRYNDEAAAAVKSTVAKVRPKLKNKTKNAAETELTVEVRVTPSKADITDKLLAINGVASAMLVEFTGDV